MPDDAFSLFYTGQHHIHRNNKTTTQAMLTIPIHAHAKKPDVARWQCATDAIGVARPPLAVACWWRVRGGWRGEGAAAVAAGASRGGFRASSAPGRIAKALAAWSQGLVFAPDTSKTLGWVQGSNGSLPLIPEANPAYFEGRDYPSRSHAVRSPGSNAHRRLAWVFCGARSFLRNAEVCYPLSLWHSFVVSLCRGVRQGFCWVVTRVEVFCLCFQGLSVAHALGAATSGCIQLMLCRSVFGQGTGEQQQRAAHASCADCTCCTHQCPPFHTLWCFERSGQPVTIHAPFRPPEYHHHTPLVAARSGHACP